MNRLLLEGDACHGTPLENVYFNVRGVTPNPSNFSVDENVTESDILTIESLLERTVVVMDDCIALWRRDALACDSLQKMIRERNWIAKLID
jgi:hypothetical protein